MLLARKSILSGKVRTIEIPVTLEQLKAYEEGATLEQAFPKLNLTHREFISTGLTRNEYIESFGIDDNNFGRTYKAPIPVV